jgi:tellurite methyltransferase
MVNDTNYWNEFYNNSEEKVMQRSDFCDFVMKSFETTNISNVLDAGCGNGRDSIALSTKYNVDGADNSGFVQENGENLNFIDCDFVNMEKDKYDLIYSRFSYHSISDEQQLNFLSTILPNTYLAIEARSIKDIDLDVCHGKTHYRNYIDLDKIMQQLHDNDFFVYYSHESKGLAIYKTEDPICVRIICKKKSLDDVIVD